MLSKKRIKEAETNVRNYLAEGLLKRGSAQVTKHIFLKNAKESLKAAKIMLDNNIPLWTIVAAYYSMFYIANAVLNGMRYKLGTRIVHRVTADALIAIVRTKMGEGGIETFEEAQEEAMRLSKTDELIESFDFERKKRSFIQYQTPEEDIKTKAITSFKRAKEFLFNMELLLGDK